MPTKFKRPSVSKRWIELEARADALGYLTLGHLLAAAEESGRISAEQSERIMRHWESGMGHAKAWRHAAGPALDAISHVIYLTSKAP